MKIWFKTWRVVQKMIQKPIIFKNFALLKSCFKFWRYVDIQVTLWYEVFFLFKSLRRCKKLIQKLIFLKVFDSKHFFSKNIALRKNLSKKVGKRQFWHFNGVIWPKKRHFEIKLTKKGWCFETSFTSKSVALLKFDFQTWCVVKGCFKIWHSVELPIQKMTNCIKLTKNWLILKILIRIWRSVKNLFQKQILFQSVDRITVFFPFFKTIVGFWENAKLQKLAIFGVKRSKSDCLKAELSSKPVFFTNYFSLQSLMRCKFFLGILTQSKTFDSKIVELWKNGSSLKHLKFLIQNMPRCTKMIEKLIFFKANFLEKQLFPEQSLQESQKNNFEVFTV